MENAKTFDQLYNLAVKGEVEKKGTLDYLSWAYAWATLMEQDGTATKKVYETSDGGLVWKDPIGAHVKVSVTAFGVERIEYLPIMDSRNQPVAFENADSTIVNKTIQRAVTKAIAQFGIGLKLYAGEDLPTEGGGLPPEKQSFSQPTKKGVLATTAQIGFIKSLLAKKSLTPEYCKTAFGALPEDLTADQASKAITELKDGNAPKNDFKGSPVNETAPKEELPKPKNTTVHFDLFQVFKGLTQEKKDSVVSMLSEKYGANSVDELSDEQALYVLAAIKKSQAKEAEKKTVEDDLPF